MWNGDNGCEMKKGRKQYIVNLRKKVCSCRSWQILGIPCARACCAIWYDESEPDEYLDKYYHPTTYIKAYQHALQLINKPHEWKKSELEPLIPPFARKMPRRPKKNRLKSSDELKKNGSI